MDQLTPGAVNAIFNDLKDHPAFNSPVLQILQIKKLTAPNCGDRYRLVISDSIHFMQAMMATQLNPLASSGQLLKHGVVRVTKFTLNKVQDKRIAIILGLEVVFQTVPDKIGNPVCVEPSEGIEIGNPAPKMEERKSNFSNNPAYDSSGYKQESAHIPSYTGPAPPPFQPNLNPTFSAQKVDPPSSMDFKSKNGQANPMPMSVGNFGNQGYGNQTPMVTHPIASLSPYQNKWCVKVRVANKSDIRHWHNAKGEGKLFSCTLLDDTGEIKAIGFNDSVDKFYDLLQLNKVYYVSGAKIVMAKKQFSTVQNQYEMQFEATTTISPCLDSSSVPTIKYHFIPLQQLEMAEKDAIVDVIGVVHSVGEVTEIISKTTSKPFSKRDITIVDTSQHQARLTLWGKAAMEFEGSNHPVISVKGAKVGDYGGKSLSALSGTLMEKNPDISEAFALRGWYDNSGKQLEFKSLMNAPNAAGNTGIAIKEKNRKHLCQIKDENLGLNEKPDYFTSKVTVMFVRDNIAYPACPSENCNKKVILDQDMWRCERCAKSFNAPDYRYIMSANVCDHTGPTWIQCFNDVAEQIIQCPANNLMEIKDIDPEKFKAIIAGANFHQFDLNLRAKQETYGDETKIRITAVTAQPLHFVTYGNYLASMIDKYQKAA